MEESHELMPALLIRARPTTEKHQGARSSTRESALAVLWSAAPSDPAPNPESYGPFIQTLRRREPKRGARCWHQPLLKARSLRTYLPSFERGEKGPTVGHDTFKEIRAQRILGGIGPVDIRTRESLFNSLTDLTEEGLILRESLMPMPVK